MVRGSRTRQSFTSRPSIHGYVLAHRSPPWTLQDCKRGMSAKPVSETGRSERSVEVPPYRQRREVSHVQDVR